MAEIGHIRLATLCSLAPALMLGAPVASGGERWTGALALVSDHVDRGVSRSGGEPAVLGSASYQLHPGWTAGAWGAIGIDGSGSADSGSRSQLDVYLQRNWILGGDWSLQLGARHYEYLERDAYRVDYDYDELSAALTYQGRLTATLSWSPNRTRYVSDWWTRKRDAVAYEMTALQPLNAYWSAYAGLGRYELESSAGSGYWYWNAGIAFSWDALQIDLTHIGAGDAAQRMFGHEERAHRWTAALSWRF